MICVLMAILGCLSLVYDAAVQSSVVGTMLLLVVIGFCIYGPQVLLVGTAPADLAHRGTSAAAAGFVNFMGYMGAATGDVVTGYYSARSTAAGRWRSTSGPAGPLPARRSRPSCGTPPPGKSACVPAIVPKLAAIATLGLAAAATGWAGQPVALQVADDCGRRLSRSAHWLSRWAARPGLGRGSRQPALCVCFVYSRHECR